VGNRSLNSVGDLIAFLRRQRRFATIRAGSSFQPALIVLISDAQIQASCRQPLRIPRQAARYLNQLVLFCSDRGLQASCLRGAESQKTMN